MRITSTVVPTALAALCLAGIAVSNSHAASVGSADTFGTLGNEFNIDFVLIGNAGNTADAGGYGAVNYNYRISTYEISQDAIARASASGMQNVTAGAWSGSKPAANTSWFEAAAFVNWLNTSTGHQAAYDLVWNGSAWTMNLWNTDQASQAGGENLYRHKDAYYFLPSENEWYKAAYHKNDGATGNYWDYATGSDTPPTAVASGTLSGSAVYNGAATIPADVNASGGQSAYGTIGQNGNVFEWAESAFTAPNNSAGEPRVYLGGSLDSGPEGLIASSTRFFGDPSSEFDLVGFRIASIPEPGAGTLIVAAGLMWIAGRRRGPGSFRIGTFNG